jgi:hypothetical protein
MASGGQRAFPRRRRSLSRTIQPCSDGSVLRRLPLISSLQRCFVALRPRVMASPIPISLLVSRRSHRRSGVEVKEVRGLSVADAGWVWAGQQTIKKAATVVQAVKRMESMSRLSRRHPQVSSQDQSRENSSEDNSRESTAAGTLLPLPQPLCPRDMPLSCFGQQSFGSLPVLSLRTASQRAMQCQACRAPGVRRPAGCARCTLRGVLRSSCRREVMRGVRLLRRTLRGGAGGEQGGEHGPGTQDAGFQAFLTSRSAPQ